MDDRYGIGLQASPDDLDYPAARAYIEELLPDLLDGRSEPGKVFDRTVDLEDVPAGYRATAGRQALKALVTP